jgi:hypothetical protein
MPLPIIAATLALTVCVSAIEARAQTCGPCGKKPTINACIQCVRSSYPGKYTESMRTWCGKAVPACRKQK